MKFVVSSLLFVYLILQIVASLRRCFDSNENLILTIIVILFSTLGLIGLTIKNRFLLLVYAVSATLILIATIIIYSIDISTTSASFAEDLNEAAIESLQQERMKEHSSRKAHNLYHRYNERKFRNKSSSNSNDAKLNLLLNKLMRQRQQRTMDAQLVENLSGEQQSQQHQQATRQYVPSRIKSGLAEHLSNKQRAGSKTKSKQANQTVVTLATLPLDDYSDPLGSMQAIVVAPVETAEQLLKNANVRITTELPFSQNNNNNASSVDSALEDEEFELSLKIARQRNAHRDRIEFERYQNVVSKAIDLVLHSLLAFWIALLIEDDANWCFGSSSQSRKGKQRRRGSSAFYSNSRVMANDRKPSEYNYNGVRYSIRPDDLDANRLPMR